MKKVDIKGSLTRTAGVGAGAVGGAYLNKIAFVGNLSAPIRGAIKIGLGGFVLPMLAKGKAGNMIENVGDGMIAVGVIELVNGTVFKTNPVSLSGMDTLPTLGNVRRVYVDSARVAGADTLPTLGNASDTY